MKRGNVDLTRIDMLEELSDQIEGHHIFAVCYTFA